MSEPHIALYRKYRPQTFDDVVGQDTIVSLLTSSIAKKTISHAYLFCGGRGTGKTTVARIFAREIGCSPEDTIEIDAASNRGIDEIRELREAVRTAPFSSPYKVYIIDEAHMLTKEAANALLKTLEEPPSHVIFILATTDPDKLPSTIVSRCQKLVFQLPAIATLAYRLAFVARKEGKEIDEATGELIARHGKGSYRDALGVLEQVLTKADTTVSYADVSSLLGIADKEQLLTLLQALCYKDTSLLAKLLSDFEISTLSPIRMYDDLVELIRLGLLLRSGGKNEGTPEELALLAKEYPYCISSKTLLFFLSKRHLLLVGATSVWTAFQAIVFEQVKEGN